MKGKKLPLRVTAAILIDAAQPRVKAVYSDYSNWPDLFPKIRSVRLVREERESMVLEVEHEEGLVPNVLRIISPHVIQLEEHKRRYDATFVNDFQAVSKGTYYTLTAFVVLKGSYRLLRPFLRGYIRQQMTRFVLEPVKRYAEKERQP